MKGAIFTPDSAIGSCNHIVLSDFEGRKVQLQVYQVYQIFAVKCSSSLRDITSQKTSLMNYKISGTVCSWEPALLNRYDCFLAAVSTWQDRCCMAVKPEQVIGQFLLENSLLPLKARQGA